eukprot:COSAG06_NODE_7626_length_2434_cov_207.581585_2_plen_69_part_00
MQFKHANGFVSVTHRIWGRRGAWLGRQQQAVRQDSAERGGEQAAVNRRQRLTDNTKNATKTATKRVRE